MLTYKAYLNSGKVLNFDGRCCKVNINDDHVMVFKDEYSDVIAMIPYEQILYVIREYITK
ncbi:MAG: hypothetical protein Q4G33_07855 [bacterium]|nr:hypothetical protein [bacterium]